MIMHTLTLTAFLTADLFSICCLPGLALSHAAVYADFGGQDITANLRSKLAENNFHISHFDTKLLKEKHCFVSKWSNYQDNLGSISGGLGPECEMESFYLPDGEEVAVARSGTLRSLTRTCTHTYIQTDIYTHTHTLTHTRTHTHAVSSSCLRFSHTYAQSSVPSHPSLQRYK